MRPGPFAYRKPKTLDEALALLAADDDAKILAGGQSLVPMMNFRVAMPGTLVDVNGLKDLDYVRRDGDVLRIGALARHNTVARSELVAACCPLIPMAYHWVAHDTIKNRGTLAGNLSHADPASEMPAVMLALEATMTLASTRGRREVAAADFFLGMFTTALEPDEMLVEIAVPVAKDGQRLAFAELSPRKGDFALAGIAIALTVTDGAIRDARIAACGIGDVACRIGEAETYLEGRPLDVVTAEACGRVASASVDPLSDHKAPAAYRKELVRLLVARQLRELVAAPLLGEAA